MLAGPQLQVTPCTDAPAEILPHLTTPSPPSHFLQIWHTAQVTAGALAKHTKNSFYVKLVIENWEHTRHALSHSMPPAIIQGELACTQVKARAHPQSISLQKKPRLSFSIIICEC